MPDASLQERRLVAFADLFERDGSNPNEYDHDVEEDPRPYFDGTKELARYVCVTLNWSHSNGKLFYLPEFNDVELAMARAQEYDRDDLFEEIPVKVVDLDTGEELYAEMHYTWSARGGAWRTMKEPTT